MVAHLRAPLLEDHRVVVHHRIVLAQIVLAQIVLAQIVLALAALLHLQDLQFHVHNLVRNAQLAEVVLTAPEQHVKFLKVVKPVIHAGFVLLHKNGINLEFVRASSNQIFQMMSLVRNSKRVFAQSY
jgi:hypothetical protein